MHTLIVQTEEGTQQLSEIEKEEVVVFTVSQKVIRQLIEVLNRIQLHYKKRRWTYNEKW